jgi:hypothetical protein
VVRIHCAVGFSAVLTAVAVILSAPATAENAQAAQGPPFIVPLFISSNKEACYESDNLSAIIRLATIEQDRINRTGGIGGRPLMVRVVDDERDDATAIANMRAAIDDKETLAMLGMFNSNRAQATFKALGQSLRDSAIPFISAISVNSIFADFPNVYTMQVSQDAERLPVIRHDQAGVDREAFAADKACCDARLHHPLEHTPEDVAHPEALVAGARECRMIRDLVLDAQATEPAIGQVHLHLAAQQPLRADGKHVADDEHPDHEHRIDRRPAKMRVVGR